MSLHCLPKHATDVEYLEWVVIRCAHDMTSGKFIYRAVVGGMSEIGCFPLRAVELCGAMHAMISRCILSPWELTMISSHSLHQRAMLFAQS